MRLTISKLTLIIVILTVVAGQAQNPFDIKRKDTTQKKETVKPVKSPLETATKPVTTKPADTTGKKPVNQDTVTQKKDSKANIPAGQNPFDLNARPSDPNGAVRPPNLTTKQETPGILQDTATPKIIQSPAADTAINPSGQSKSIFEITKKDQKDEAKDKAVTGNQENKKETNKQVETYFERITGSLSFWVLFICLLGVTAVVNLNRSFMAELTQSLISENFFRLTYREFSKGISQYLHIALYLVFFLQGALFINFILRYWSNFELSYWWILIIFGALYFTKHFVLWLLASLFPVEKETAQYSFSTMQFNIFLGLILFAINWLLAFGPANLHNGLILTGIGAFVVLYLLRQFRGLLIGVRLASLYKFQFFLYLCAIEIGPILLIYRQISLQLFS
ncbi:MAG: DUF4271 domain-containing protein [Saprospiraceae bacterium]|nr:DUF4271 domain-containing protein [Saprospiraceae bacterium]MCB9321816.1 DUF4271 domain-containing protein [Lewinellaceae bacterium]